MSELASRDAAESCCLDLPDGALCSSPCRAECRVYTAGRERLFRSRLLLDGSGTPSCALPTGGNAELSCSGAVTQLEVEVLIDSYFVVPTLSKWMVCVRDTVVEAPSVERQVLY